MRVLGTLVTNLILIIAAPINVAATQVTQFRVPAVSEFNAAIPYPVDRWLSQNNTNGVFASFSLAPSHIVVKNQPVELRLHLLNTTNSSRTVSVQFYFDSVIEANKQMDSSREIVLRPFKDNYLRVWIKSGDVGRRKVLAQIVGNSLSISRSHDIYVEDSVNSAGVTTTSPTAATTIWIEPGSLCQALLKRNTYAGTFVGPLPQFTQTQISETQLFNYLSWLKFTGIRTIVLAYTQYQSYRYFSLPTVSAVSGTSCINYDLTDKILSGAQTLGINVIVGLNKADNENLFLDVASDLLIPGATLGKPIAQLSPALRSQVATSVAQQTALARELWLNYGYRYSSFYGVYLAHESNCFDQIGQLNYDPVIANLRQFLPYDKPVMISPPIFSRSCSSAESMNVQVRNSKADIIAYQDGVGAGYVSDNGFPLKTFVAQRAINGLEAVFTQRAAWHQNTNKHIWSNLELWRYIRHPEVPFESDYSQEGSYSGSMLEVRQQIEASAPYVNQVMLNEGARYFFPQHNWITGDYADMSNFNRHTFWFPGLPLWAFPGASDLRTTGDLWNEYLVFSYAFATRLRNAGF